MPHIRSKTVGSEHLRRETSHLVRGRSTRQSIANATQNSHSSGSASEALITLSQVDNKQLKRPQALTDHSQDSSTKRLKTFHKPVHTRSSHVPVESKNGRESRVTSDKSKLQNENTVPCHELIARKTNASPRKLRLRNSESSDSKVLLTPTNTKTEGVILPSSRHREQVKIYPGLEAPPVSETVFCSTGFTRKTEARPENELGSLRNEVHSKQLSQAGKECASKESMLEDIHDSQNHETPPKRTLRSGLLTQDKGDKQDLLSSKHKQVIKKLVKECSELFISLRSKPKKPSVQNARNLLHKTASQSKGKTVFKNTTNKTKCTGASKQCTRQDGEKVTFGVSANSDDSECSILKTKEISFKDDHSESLGHKDDSASFKRSKSLSCKKSLEASAGAADNEKSSSKAYDHLQTQGHTDRETLAKSYVPGKYVEKSSPENASTSRRATRSWTENSKTCNRMSASSESSLENVTTKCAKNSSTISTKNSKTCNEDARVSTSTGTGKSGTNGGNTKLNKAKLDDRADIVKGQTVSESVMCKRSKIIQVPSFTSVDESVKTTKSIHSINSTTNGTGKPSQKIYSIKPNIRHSKNRRSKTEAKARIFTTINISRFVEMNIPNLVLKDDVKESTLTQADDKSRVDSDPTKLQNSKDSEKATLESRTAKVITKSHIRKFSTKLKKKSRAFELNDKSEALKTKGMNTDSFKAFVDAVKSVKANPDSVGYTTRSHVTTNPDSVGHITRPQVATSPESVGHITCSHATMSPDSVGHNTRSHAAMSPDNVGHNTRSHATSPDSVGHITHSHAAKAPLTTVSATKNLKTVRHTRVATTKFTTPVIGKAKYSKVILHVDSAKSRSSRSIERKFTSVCDTPEHTRQVGTKKFTNEKSNRCVTRSRTCIKKFVALKTKFVKSKADEVSKLTRKDAPAVKCDIKSNLIKSVLHTENDEINHAKFESCKRNVSNSKALSGTGVLKCSRSMTAELVTSESETSSVSSMMACSLTERDGSKTPLEKDSAMNSLESRRSEIRLDTDIEKTSVLGTDMVISTRSRANATSLVMSEVESVDSLSSVGGTAASIVTKTCNTKPNLMNVDSTYVSSAKPIETKCDTVNDSVTVPGNVNSSCFKKTSTKSSAGNYRKESVSLDIDTANDTDVCIVMPCNQTDSVNSTLVKTVSLPVTPHCLTRSSDAKPVIKDTNLAVNELVQDSAAEGSTKSSTGKCQKKLENISSISIDIDEILDAFTHEEFSGETPVSGSNDTCLLTFSNQTDSVNYTPCKTEAALPVTPQVDAPEPLTKSTVAESRITEDADSVNFIVSKATALPVAVRKTEEDTFEVTKSKNNMQDKLINEAAECLINDEKLRHTMEKPGHSLSPETACPKSSRPRGDSVTCPGTSADFAKSTTIRDDKISAGRSSDKINSSGMRADPSELTRTETGLRKSARVRTNSEKSLIERNSSKKSPRKRNNSGKSPRKRNNSGKSPRKRNSEKSPRERNNSGKSSRERRDSEKSPIKRCKSAISCGKPDCVKSLRHNTRSKKSGDGNCCLCTKEVGVKSPGKTANITKVGSDLLTCAATGDAEFNSSFTTKWISSTNDATMFHVGHEPRFSKSDAEEIGASDFIDSVKFSPDNTDFVKDGSETNIDITSSSRELNEQATIAGDEGCAPTTKPGEAGVSTVSKKEAACSVSAAKIQEVVVTPAAKAGETGTTPAAKAGETGTTPAAKAGETGTTPAAKAGETGTTPAAKAGETGATPAAKAGETGATPAAKTGETCTTPTAKTAETGATASAKTRENGTTPAAKTIVASVAPTSQTGKLGAAAVANSGTGKTGIGPRNRACCTTVCTERRAVALPECLKTKASTANAEKTRVPLSENVKKSNPTGVTETTAAALPEGVKAPIAIVNMEKGETAGNIKKLSVGSAIPTILYTGKSMITSKTASGKSAVTANESGNSTVAKTKSQTLVCDIGNTEKSGNTAVNVKKVPVIITNIRKLAVSSVASRKSANTTVELGKSEDIMNVARRLTVTSTEDKASTMREVNVRESSVSADPEITTQAVYSNAEQACNQQSTNVRSCDELNFSNIVILGNTLYKKQLDKLSSTDVTVILEENLSFKNVPEVVQYYCNARTRNALWLLPLGIYSLVEFYKCSNCDLYKCLQPITRIAYEIDQPSVEDMNEHIDDVILHVKALRDCVQKELGDKGMAMLVPLIPAGVVSEMAFPDHDILHRIVSKNYAFSAYSRHVHLLNILYNNFCRSWFTSIIEPMDNRFSSVMKKYMNMNQSKNFVTMNTDKNYGYIFYPWLIMMKEVIKLALFIPMPSQFLGPIPQSDRASLPDKVVKSAMPSQVLVPVSESSSASLRDKPVESDMPNQALVLESNSASLPDKQIKSQVEVFSLFQQVVVLGGQCLSSKVMELSRHLQIHFIKECISLDNAGLDTILRYQQNWPSETLWFIITEVAQMATSSKPLIKCVMAKCQNPLRSISLECVSVSGDKSTATNSIAEEAISHALEFVCAATEHLGDNSAIFLAPVSPSSVIHRDDITLYLHNSAHAISEADSDLHVVTGKRKDWEDCSDHFKNQWLSMIISNLSGYTEPIKILNVYLESKEKMLQFINSENNCKEITLAQEAWEKVIQDLLVYFVNAKMEQNVGESSGKSTALQDDSGIKLGSSSVTEDKKKIVLQTKCEVCGCSTGKVTETSIDVPAVHMLSKTLPSTSSPAIAPAGPPAMATVGPPLPAPVGPPAMAPAGPTATVPAGPPAKSSAGLTVKSSAGPPAKLSADPPAKSSAGPPVKSSADPPAKSSAGLPAKSSAGSAAKLSTGSAAKSSAGPAAKSPDLAMHQAKSAVSVEPVKEEAEPAVEPLEHLSEHQKFSKATEQPVEPVKRSIELIEKPAEAAKRLIKPTYKPAERFVEPIEQSIHSKTLTDNAHLKEFAMNPEEPGKKATKSEKPIQAKPSESPKSVELDELVEYSRRQIMSSKQLLDNSYQLVETAKDAAKLPAKQDAGLHVKNVATPIKHSTNLKKISTGAPIKQPVDCDIKQPLELSEGPLPELPVKKLSDSSAEQVLESIAKRPLKRSALNLEYSEQQLESSASKKPNKWSPEQTLNSFGNDLPESPAKESIESYIKALPLTPVEKSQEISVRNSLETPVKKHTQLSVNKLSVTSVKESSVTFEKKSSSIDCDEACGGDEERELPRVTPRQGILTPDAAPGFETLEHDKLLTASVPLDVRDESSKTHKVGTQGYNSGQLEVPPTDCGVDNVVESPTPSKTHLLKGKTPAIQEPVATPSRAPMSSTLHSAGLIPAMFTPRSIKLRGLQSVRRKAVKRVTLSPKQQPDSTTQKSESVESESSVKPPLESASKHSSKSSIKPPSDSFRKQYREFSEKQLPESSATSQKDSSVIPLSKPLSIPLPDSLAIPLPESSIVLQQESSAIPLPESSAIPLPEPSAIPLPEPLAIPLPDPLGIPVLDPSAIPLPEPSAISLPEPSAIPLPEPSAIPLPEPSAIPLPEPSAIPLPEPSAIPLPEPSTIPLPESSAIPLLEPSAILLSESSAKWLPESSAKWLPESSAKQCPESLIEYVTISSDESTKAPTNTGMKQGASNLDLSNKFQNRVHSNSGSEENACSNDSNEKVQSDLSKTDKMKKDSYECTNIKKYPFKDVVVRVLNVSDITPLSVTLKLFQACGAAGSGKFDGDELLFRFQSLKQAAACVSGLNNFRFLDKILKVKLDGHYGVHKCNYQDGMALENKIEETLKHEEKVMVSYIKEWIDKGFNIYDFKVKMCTKNKCYSDSCVGYHNLADRRRSPGFFEYGDAMCEAILKEEECAQQDSCQYAHTAVERDYHVKQFRSLVCSGWSKEHSCPNKNKICPFVHPENADSLYHESWKDLYVEGLGNTIEFLVEAIRNLFKLPVVPGVRILVITPSIMVANLLRLAVLDLAKIFLQTVVVATYKKQILENASILIATPDALSSILVMKGKEIAHYFDTTRVVIIDDIASLLKDFMNHHQLSFIFKNIFENSDLNKVVVTEKSDEYEVGVVAALLKTQFVKVSRQGQAMQLYFRKMRETEKAAHIHDAKKQHSQGVKYTRRKRSHKSDNSVKNRSLLPTEQSSRKTNVKDRHQLTSTEKPQQQSSSSSLSSTFRDESCKRRRCYSSSSSSSSSSESFESSMSDVDDLTKSKISCFDPEMKRLFLSAEEDLKKDHQIHCQTFTSVPEAHPQYAAKYTIFKEKYQKMYAGNENLQHCQELWKEFWKQTVTKELEEKLNKKRVKLLEQFNAVAAKKNECTGLRKIKNCKEDAYSYEAGPSTSSYKSSEFSVQTLTGQKKMSLTKFINSQAEFSRFRQSSVGTPLQTTESLSMLHQILPVVSISEHKCDLGTGQSVKILTKQFSLYNNLDSLLELCEPLGLLGPAFRLIINKVKNLERDSQKMCEVLTDDDNALLIKMASEKLKSLGEASTGRFREKLLKGSIHAAELLEHATASSQTAEKPYHGADILKDVATSSQTSERPYHGVDIDKVARATLGKDVTFIVQFIKNALAYEGVTNVQAEDTNKIFLAVSSKHLSMVLENK